jgi:hypothetical protein
LARVVGLTPAFKIASFYQEFGYIEQRANFFHQGFLQFSHLPAFGHCDKRRSANHSSDVDSVLEQVVDGHESAEGMAIQK